MNAAVVKSADASRLAVVLAPLELRDVHAESEAILDAARREAAAITRRAVAETRTRIGAAMETARQRGFESGRSAGLEAGRTSGRDEALAEARQLFSDGAKSALAALNEMERQWQERHRLWFVDARQDVVALAIAIARRMAPRLAEIDAELAGQSCAAALAALGRAHELTIRAHPDDIDALRTLAERSTGRLPDAGAVRWVADETVGRGGARLDASSGSVDASLTTQVERIADELLDGWRERLRGRLENRPDTARLAANPQSAIRNPQSSPEPP